MNSSARRMPGPKDAAPRAPAPPRTCGAFVILSGVYSLKTFRIVALAEATSFLLLLVASVLKRTADAERRRHDPRPDPRHPVHRLRPDRARRPPRPGLGPAHHAAHPARRRGALRRLRRGPLVGAPGALAGGVKRRAAGSFGACTGNGVSRTGVGVGHRRSRNPGVAGAPGRRPGDRRGRDRLRDDAARVAATSACVRSSTSVDGQVRDLSGLFEASRGVEPDEYQRVRAADAAPLGRERAGLPEPRRGRRAGRFERDARPRDPRASRRTARCARPGSATATSWSRSPSSPRRGSTSTGSTFCRCPAARGRSTASRPPDGVRDALDHARLRRP